MPAAATQRARGGRASEDRRDGEGARRPSGSRTDTNQNADDRKFLSRHGDGLSPSTHRARWIHGTDERAERPGQTLATRSREVIRAWAEERNGRPATVAREDNEVRVLRFDFDAEERPAGRLRHIPWEDWLRVFEERNLVFLYQDRKRDGRQSNFFRLDSPEREDG
jgi:hypothetical protein